MVVLRLDRKSGTVEVVRVVESPKDQPITAISGLIAKFIVKIKGEINGK